MHLMTTTEGHFLKAEARKGEGGAVRIWLQFDDCSLILSPEEATALLGELAAILWRSASPKHFNVFGVDLAEGPDRTGIAPARHTTNPEG